MYFLDLATQSVRAFSPHARVALTPGYVVLHPPTAEPVPLSELAVALMYPDGRGTDAALAAEGAKGAKAAITLLGNDVVTYRVVRELGGSGMLQRLNKSTHRFEVVTQDVMETAQFLRTPVGAPTKATFEHLFILRSAQLPSRNAKAPKSPAKKPSLPQSGSVLDPAAAERRLRELSNELELSQEVEQLQAKQDEIASELFELESALKQIGEGAGELEQAEAEWQAAPTPESLGLPADILERLEHYPELLKKRDVALEKLPPEQEAPDAQPEPTPTVEVRPLYRDPRFIGAAALGTAALVAGAMLEGSARYVALLDVPMFGLAALVALQWVDGLRSSQRIGRQGGRAVARRKRIHDDFEAEAAPVRAALKSLGVESVEEAQRVLGQRAVLWQRVETLRAKWAATQANPKAVATAQKHAELKARSDAITAKLQERAGGYVRDVREVQREIQRAREAVEHARSAAAIIDAGLVDPSPVLLSLAADHVQSDPAAIATQVRDLCGQYLAALSDRRYTAVELDAKKGATVVAGDKRAPAAGLPAPDLDLFFVALRIAIVEKVSTGLRIPVIIEDLEAMVDASKHAALARILKHVGTLTQVLHVSASPAFSGAGNVKASL